jgi:hypothetical protein
VDPEDPALWRVGRYPDFLAARRELLATAANGFLDQLRAGNLAGCGRPLYRLTVVAPEAEDGSRRDQVMALVAELDSLLT